ncbi:MAG: hypothetical protein KK926_02010 [Methanomethylovorans sp.]|nr:hypothetical protein [Methanomethylovorans sp.]
MDTADGHAVASSAFDYPHGVLDRNLPDGTPLPADYALQHPQVVIGWVANPPNQFFLSPRIATSPPSVVPRDDIRLKPDCLIPNTCYLLPHSQFT